MTPITIVYGVVIVVIVCLLGGLFFIIADKLGWFEEEEDAYQKSENWGAK